jgi:hypothetical protein
MYFKSSTAKINTELYPVQLSNIAITCVHDAFRRASASRYET